jgi:site-specific recombinase XerD
MKATTTLAVLLHAFFHEWMGQQRSLSTHTILSYRDTWRLFLRFMAKHKNRAVPRLVLSDLDAPAIRAFLLHCERERKVSVGTRNCRLAALRSFFGYVAAREPAAAAQCAEVLRIPIKRGPRRAMCYLDTEEVSTILQQPNRSRLEGQRDHVLLVLLYNTGARIQEALNLCPRDIRFTPPTQLRLLGKGNKERICPLWPETVALIRALMKRQPRAEDSPLFVNRYGDPLGAAGARFKLAQYVSAAAEKLPSLKRKKVTPHTYRHTVGVHLVAAGVDVTVIRNLFGHASLETTNQYARADLETKRKALEQVETSARRTKPPRWRRDPELLSWLDSL